MITLDSPELKNISPQKLGELLIEAKKAYYTDSKPIMDDHTFDTLEDILRKINPYHRIFTKVGTSRFNTGFDKKKHSMPMGSQNKVNKIDDLIHYFELKKIPSDTDFVVQPKCDGISLEIEYKNGKLVDAITRGNGEIGDVITQNVVKMKNFVKEFKDNFSGSVRCEIVMLEKDFQKIIKNRPVKGGGPATVGTEGFYSNSRNATSGISQRLDGKFSELCSLYAVDIFSHQKQFVTEVEKIDFLKHHGFTPVEDLHCQTFDQIEKIYQEFLFEKRKNYPFEIDGLVIKINNTQLEHRLGSKNNRPKGQVAYKFPSRSSQTRIININWQVGPMGTITPVAEVDPIEISGAIITFASLANYDLIKEKNINIDDIVEIQRRGDVIPHIENVITKIKSGHIIAPEICPSCGTKLIIDNKFLRCPNLKNCPTQILGSLKLFCSTLEIKGISEKTIDKLYQVKLLRLPGDFYDLKVSDFEKLFGLGHKSGTNIINEIQNKRKLSLKQIFDAAIIPNFSSQRIIQLINAGFDTPEKILNITIDQLEALPGIQITLAQKIYQGIQNRKDFIQSILVHVETPDLASLQKIPKKLFGLSFAITGSLEKPRKEIEDQIISLGGQLASSVSKNTDYLITNETEANSNKFLNAKKFGIKIISEAEFESLAV
ncbi:MAG: NAD-dependent DNA ligase LigA [Candidatus Shapirobacteria bacterium]|nr:NAD-dependent DNA ligase LigA [Candidatus Shapirobacteria bacterium]